MFGTDQSIAALQPPFMKIKTYLQARKVVEKYFDVQIAAKHDLTKFQGHLPFMLNVLAKIENSV